MAGSLLRHERYLNDQYDFWLQEIDLYKKEIYLLLEKRL